MDEEDRAIEENKGERGRNQKEIMKNRGKNGEEGGEIGRMKEK